MAVLEKLGFVYFAGGKVRMGTDRPLPCGLEGYRHNETPVRYVEVAPFYLARTKVTNIEYENVKNKHRRTLEGQGDNCPVSDVTYGEALNYCKRLSILHDLEFRLPTEPEWTYAASPRGQEFTFGDEPDITQTHVFNDGTDEWIVPVNDPRWAPTPEGLDQMGHNVSEMMQGMRHTITGEWESETDGLYYIVKGGNYGHCKNAPGIHRRSIADVVDRNPRIGFRLAHNA